VTASIPVWIGFNLLVLAMLALDLGVFHRESHVINIKESLIWSAIWVIVALLFNVGVYYWFGPQKALQFLPVISLNER
jgi:tellurite resistance protein TerC